MATNVAYMAYSEFHVGFSPLAALHLSLSVSLIYDLPSLSYLHLITRFLQPLNLLICTASHSIFMVLLNVALILLTKLSVCHRSKLVCMKSTGFVKI